MGRGKTGNFWKAAAILLGCALLTGCGNTGEVDDYATNIGYEARGSNGTTQVVQSESGSSATTQTAGIPKEEIKVGVLHLSDPAEGSGYTYTHDLGIQGMQQNLGLSDDQSSARLMSMTVIRRRPDRQFRNVLMKAVISSSLPAGDIWKLQRKWRKNIRTCTSPMAPAT